MPRVLHILSQRPSRTGSGVTLDAVVRLAAADRWEQCALVGVPADEHEPAVGGLPAVAVKSLTFAADDASLPADLPFPVPGMSDVMPYRSTVWSDMTDAMLDRYRAAWRRRLATVVDEFRPDLIHGNHVWIVGSLLKEVAPTVPAVLTCHATGLRQLELCPGQAAAVVAGCRRVDHFCVLREDHRRLLAERLGVPADRITVVGAGYRDDLFTPPDGPASARRGQLLYVGKYSHAKGLPWLLDAFADLAATRPELRLHVAGSGAGPEAARLRERMAAMAPRVVLHGQVDQRRLAALMRGAAVAVLPSFYEGVPLVLAEAAAAGCRLVATDLPGVREQLAPRLGPLLEMVPPPRLRGVDTPDPRDLPDFTAALATALGSAADRPPLAAVPAGVDLAPFTWAAVFDRVAAVWRALLD